MMLRIVIHDILNKEISISGYETLKISEIFSFGYWEPMRVVLLKAERGIVATGPHKWNVDMCFWLTGSMLSSTRQLT